MPLAFSTISSSLMAPVLASVSGPRLWCCGCWLELSLYSEMSLLANSGTLWVRWLTLCCHRPPSPSSTSPSSEGDSEVSPRVRVVNEPSHSF